MRQRAGGGDGGESGELPGAAGKGAAGEEVLGWVLREVCFEKAWLGWVCDVGRRATHIVYSSNRVHGVNSVFNDIAEDMPYLPS